MSHELEREALVECEEREENETNGAEEGRRVHLRDGLVSHTHQAVHGIVFPVGRERLGGSQALSNSSDAGDCKDG